MSERYPQLVFAVFDAMTHDDYDQSEKLADVYILADEAGKELLDRAFTCLCGWRLRTLMDRVVESGLEEPDVD